MSLISKYLNPKTIVLATTIILVLGCAVNIYHIVSAINRSDNAILYKQHGQSSGSVLNHSNNTSRQDGSQQLERKASTSYSGALVNKTLQNQRMHSQVKEIVIQDQPNQRQAQDPRYKQNKSAQQNNIQVNQQLQSQQQQQLQSQQQYQQQPQKQQPPTQPSNPNPNPQKPHFPKFPPKTQQTPIQQIPQLNKQQLSPQQIDSSTRFRVQSGRPRQQDRRIRVWTVRGALRGTGCGVLDCVGLVTGRVVDTVREVIGGLRVGYVVVITDRNDIFAAELMYSSFNQSKYILDSYNVTIDSDYKFITHITTLISCHKILYLPQNLTIQPSKSSPLLPYLSKPPTTKVYISTLPPASLPLQQYNKYIYIFDSWYWRVVAPVNYHYYGKYTMEELLVLPVVALAGRFGLVEGMGGGVVGEGGGVSGKYYALNNIRRKEKQDGIMLCFVSYATNPHEWNQQQISAYLQSIRNINPTNNINISIIIHLPLNLTPPTPTPSPNPTLLHQIARILQLPHLTNLKLILTPTKTSSSLSNYQSVMTHCPANSIVVSSRHNVRFLGEFARLVRQAWGNAGGEYRYFVEGGALEVGGGVGGGVGGVLGDRDRLGNVQIYNSSLFLSSLFWDIKSSQVDFYDAQLSFILPLLSIAQYKVYNIDKPLTKVTPRVKSSQQQTQTHHIINKWQKSHLSTPTQPQHPHPPPTPASNPHPYNPLQNEAHHPHRLPQIPKILHKPTPPAKYLELDQKLMLIARKSNPEFVVREWSVFGVSYSQFPVTYSLVMRCLEGVGSRGRGENDRREKMGVVLANALMKYQVLYNYGGIFLDNYVQINTDLSHLLYYQIFTTRPHFQQTHPHKINYLQNSIMGCTQHNYYLKILLNQIISQSTINYESQQIMYYAGAYDLARVFNDEEIFTVLGYGGNLFESQSVNYTGLCFYPDQSKDRQRQNKQGSIFQFQVQNKKYNIQIPCHAYPESYIIEYRLQ